MFSFEKKVFPNPLTFCAKQILLRKIYFAKCFMNWISIKFILGEFVFQSKNIHKNKNKKYFKNIDFPNAFQIKSLISCMIFLQKKSSTKDQEFFLERVWENLFFAKKWFSQDESLVFQSAQDRKFVQILKKH